MMINSTPLTHSIRQFILNSLNLEIQVICLLGMIISYFGFEFDQFLQLERSLFLEISFALTFPHTLLDWHYILIVVKFPVECH